MFDMVDYRRRQRNIRRVTIGSLLVAITTFVVAVLSFINDANTQTLIEFTCLCSLLVFLFGLLASFNAWYEMKVVKYGERIRKE